jgi:hypothetical protein
MLLNDLIFMDMAYCWTVKFLPQRIAGRGSTEGFCIERFL